MGTGEMVVLIVLMGTVGRVVHTAVGRRGAALPAGTP